MSHALQIIMHHSASGRQAREEFFTKNAALVDKAAQKIALCMINGCKLLCCGNGGSAADAQHLAAEFVNRYVMERPPLPALALSVDSSILTSIGNDYSFEQIFSKQLLALGQKGDVLLAISTSGNSANVLKAIEVARERSMFVIGLTGKDGGRMAQACDLLLNVEHHTTAIIQEVHLAVEHLLCHLCDYYLFENVKELMALQSASV